MGLWDKLRGEFVDIIEWTDDSQNTMVYRFERHGNEIKYGAKLTVRPGQVGVFVNEGKVADVFFPGMYTLETKNLPLLSTLLGWKHGFESPFKAEVYFASTRNFTDLKWGTKNPIMMRDVEFGPVRLRAFGTYTMKVKRPATFIEQIVGTDGRFTTDEISDQLRNLSVSRFTDLLGECKIPILDLAGNYDELSEFITDRIGPEFKEYGLELTKFLVENISLPKAVEEALDKRTSMGIVGNLQQYTQFQAANALEAGAKNPGGSAASDAMGMGMGFVMAQQLGKSLGASDQTNANQGGASGPPPVPQAVTFFTVVNGAQAGPFDVSSLSAQVASGQFTGETLVWKDGMANWTCAAQVPELASLFARKGPPPIP